MKHNGMIRLSLLGTCSIPTHSKGIQLKKLAPFSPQIRTKSDRHLITLTPNLWGEGLGMRGNTDSENHDTFR
ncbi:MAG: hypothetical protein ACI87E_003597, partial [Mariniblastus sp.]